MIKKLSILVMIFSLIVLSSCSNKPIKEHSSSTHNLEALSTIESNNRLLTQIYQVAETGKVSKDKWKSGEDTIMEVEKDWGLADNKSEANSGTYATYEKKQVVFGFNEKGQIYDLRSHSNKLQHITQKETEQVLGAPDEIRHFQEQNIYVYQINQTYQLKLIFPPATDNTDRKLSHISVVYLPWDPSVNETDPSYSIDTMTITEKIGQLMMIGLESTSIDQQATYYIKQKKVGGFILLKKNIENTQQTVDFINDLKRNNDNQIPLFLGIDEEGGRITRLPEEISATPSSQAIGKRNDSDWSYQVGKLLAKKVKAFGFNINFAPVLDVNSNPNNPVIGDRSFGDEPELVSNMAIAQMKGLAAENVMPVGKHFPGHGDTAVDSHIDLPLLDHSLERLQQVELVPFQQAIDHGVEAMMIGHLMVPSIDPDNPATLSEEMIQGVLRNELGFDGLVISDDLTMGAILENYEIGDAAVQAIQAGTDLLLICHGYDQIDAVFDAMEEAVANGEISMQNLDDSVDRVLKLKEKYGITNEKMESIDVEQLNQEIKEILQTE
ncbi:beta-N-acetylhexosaminidase [Gracilibacillus salitolerans]|uniref:Beta-N-acetylhexosaminidase n=1 Tax=Gracilibacillus salitolerans TaxID=2663022 RepID=A0A5Q2THK4_9BACI|nr:beta-N-acetylhexosaminidase [Gracilibacillus salitolerans]QGH34165.1 beta-N-acetylhexosaminidase [Gracilibacillus salitolerans]